VLDKRFIDELRSRLTLSDIIGRRVKLTRAGREFKAPCPFHNEKTPSFYVNDDKGFFHCFGCGAHGDAVSFRMRYDNLGFMEAVESLAGEAGMQLPAPDPKAAEKYDELQRLMTIMERMTKWYATQLHDPRNEFALKYLLERGLTEETISQFRLGYAPNNWDALREAMIQEDIKIDDLVSLGVLKISTREDKANKPYSFFRGRVMFPVTDAKGRVIAFGGRHLDAAFAGERLTEKPPKYINSAEQILFNKSGVLYNLARARALVSAQNPLILVEGYMDVIALAQAGFKTAVAPLGTALTEEHMMLAWKVSADAPPILCFDGDSAGINAAYRALDRLLPHLTAQKSLRLVFLPNGEDPDSLIRNKGANAIRTLFENAMGVFDAIWQREADQSASTPEGRAGLQSRLEARIKQVNDPVLQQNYRQALRERMFQLGRSRTSFGSKRQGSMTPSMRPVQRPTGDTERMAWQAILAMAVNHPFLLQEDSEAISLNHAPDPALEQLREALVTIVHEGPPDALLTSDEVKQSLSERGLSDTITTLLHDSIYRQYGFARPDTTAEQVLEGWKDVWTRMQLKTVTQDKTKLLQQVRTRYSDDIADQIHALSQQEQNLLDETP
jgi:DNA primase